MAETDVYSMCDYLPNTMKLSVCELRKQHEKKENVIMIATKL